MPGLVAKCDTARDNDLLALGASGGVFVLVTLDAVYIVVLGYETIRSDGVLADVAAETAIVPLPPAILHLFRTGSEGIVAAVATGGKGDIETVGTVDLVCLGAERPVDQRLLALGAQETGVVPVALLVGEVPGVDADGLGAVLAGVCKVALIARDTVGPVLLENIALAGQVGVAMATQEVVHVKVFVHRLQVLIGEYQRKVLTRKV